MNVYLIGMIISMAAYIVIGIIISKNVKNANDFYVAGRNAPTLLIVGSLIASLESSGLFMGDAGEAYNGIFVPFFITIVIMICGYILGSVFFGKYLRRSGVLTIPEFFGRRFDSRAMKLLATGTQTVIVLIYMISVMQGIGTLMSYVTGIDYRLCILLAMITFTILTTLSGSKGVLITDTIMFIVFMAASIIAAFVIAHKCGGWYSAVAGVTAIDSDWLSWHGDLSYLYDTGAKNIIWAFTTGVVWVSVCMVAPWQASRYLMAKNEHAVIRSSVWAALFAFLVEFFLAMAALFVRNFQPDIENGSYALIWAATNIMPKVLGVIVLTGVLAAAISSATTFLSLIGSSVANDIVTTDDDKKKVSIGRITIVIAAVVEFILVYINPPAIYKIILLGGIVVACSWMPVAIAAVWSKRVTKTGAFWGMLMGFIGCGATKVLSSLGSISLPFFVDPFYVGFVCNVLGLVIGSALTQVTPEERLQREKLFVVPESELVPEEVRKTKRSVLGFALLGVLFIVIMLVMWVIPYLKAL